MIPSFVLLNKEAGISSFQAMNQLKKDIGNKRVGHCGTLDPFADGLLLALHFTLFLQCRVVDRSGHGNLYRDFVFTCESREKNCACAHNQHQ